MEKLRHDYQLLEKENGLKQETIKTMEVKYLDDQTKWVKLCERVGSQMDDHSAVYHDKFPIDPFSRDQTFTKSVLLQREMQTAINQCQHRKPNQKSFGKQASMKLADRSEDFNHLNVIKTDFKTFQRQKEIINVISEMSLQISKSMAQCMTSFISQVDG